MIKCISCDKFSFNLICKEWQKNLLKPSFLKKELTKDFFVYSFYQYEEIKQFINSKYYFFGDRIFNILAKLSFKQFSKNFYFQNKVYAIPIDDHTRHNFSHTAILAKHLQSDIIEVQYNTLKATNIVKYAGHNLSFRQSHKRDFIYKGKSNIQIILVDDLITSGSTILEAKEILEKNNCEVLFALTLAG